MAAGWEMTLSRVLRSRLRVQHLRMVVALSETGSVCAAARALGLTQSAITKSLHELERLLDCTLFIRSTHGVRPTEACHELLKLARRFTGDLEALMRRLDTLKSGEQASLCIGVLRGAPMKLASQLLARLRHERPLLRARLVIDNYSQLRAELTRGGIDMALLSRYDEEADLSLGFGQIGVIHPVIVASSGHPLADFGTIDHENLQRYGWLLHCAQDPMASVLRTAFRKAGLPPPHIDIEGVDPGGAIDLLRDGNQLALLDQNSVANALQDGGLISLAHALTLEPLPYGVAWPANAEGNALLDYVRTQLMIEMSSGAAPLHARRFQAPHVRAYDGSGE